MQTPDFPRFSYNQAIRSRSDLPGVEAFEEEPLEIPFVVSTKHRDAIDCSLRSQIYRFRRLASHSILLYCRMPTSRTVAIVKVDSQQRQPI
jgi:hypothetical protein